MDIVKFFKRSLLTADERTLRDAGIKDDCGNLTTSGHEALSLVLAQLHEEQLVALAKKMLEEKKGKEKEEPTEE